MFSCTEFSMLVHPTFSHTEFGMLVCPIFSHTEFGNMMSMWLIYSSFHSLIRSIPSYATYYTAWVSSDNKSTSPFMRSVTPSPLSLSSFSKTSCISKSSIRGVVFSDSIWWSSFLIMPSIRSSVSDYYNRLVTIILLLSEVMPSCSCCEEKKLVYVTIMALTRYQPSSCVKCMQVNMQLSCNIWSISDAECAHYITCLTHLAFCLICLSILCSVCCWEVWVSVIVCL